MAIAPKRTREMNGKQLRNSILQLAISGKLVPQDPADEPAALLLCRISPNFTPQQTDHPLPSGWTAAPMSMLCSFTDGEKTQNKKMVNIDAKYLRGQSEGKTLSAGRYVPAGNLMILVDGENSGEVFRTPTEGYQGSTIGKTGLTSVAGACNQQINAIVPHNDVLPLYVYFACVSDYMQANIKISASATTLPILNRGNFAKLLIPLPPLAEQKRIVAKVEAAFAVLDGLSPSTH